MELKYWDKNYCSSGLGRLISCLNICHLRLYSQLTARVLRDEVEIFRKTYTCTQKNVTLYQLDIFIVAVLGTIFVNHAG